MYDPTIARFLQEDTYTGDKNDPLSLNLYVYCNNEPLMHNDPTGHFWGEIWGGTSVHASQSEMINSIMNAGANRIGPTSQTTEIGEIFQINTKYGPMETRVMQGQPGTTSAFKGPRTINTIPGTRTYVYPNGERIIGAVSKSDRKSIGHIHGQRP